MHVSRTQGYAQLAQRTTTILAFSTSTITPTRVWNACGLRVEWITIARSALHWWVAWPAKQTHIATLLISMTTPAPWLTARQPTSWTRLSARLVKSAQIVAPAPHLTSPFASHVCRTTFSTRMSTERGGAEQPAVVGMVTIQTPPRGHAWRALLNAVSAVAPS